MPYLKKNVDIGLKIKTKDNVVSSDDLRQSLSIKQHSHEINTGVLPEISASSCLGRKLFLTYCVFVVHLVSLDGRKTCRFVCERLQLLD